MLVLLVGVVAVAVAVAVAVVVVDSSAACAVTKGEEASFVVVLERLVGEMETLATAVVEPDPCRRRAAA